MFVSKGLQYPHSLSVMDVLMSLWQGKISSSAFVCCERAGLSTLAPYRGKYLKTLWQTRRCKTVTQDLCHTQPCRFMDCQDQPQQQGGIGTGTCCSLWDVWKDMGSMQEFPPGRGKEMPPRKFGGHCNVATHPKQCRISTSYMGFGPS